MNIVVCFVEGNLIFMASPGIIDQVSSVSQEPQQYFDQNVLNNYL